MKITRKSEQGLQGNRSKDDKRIGMKIARQSGQRLQGNRNDWEYVISDARPAREITRPVCIKKTLVQINGSATTWFHDKKHDIGKKVLLSI